MERSQRLGTQYVALSERVKGQGKESSRMQGGGKEKESNPASK